MAGFESLLERLPQEAMKFIVARRDGVPETGLLVGGKWVRGRTFYRDRDPMSGGPLAFVAASGQREYLEARRLLSSGKVGGWAAQLLAEIGEALDDYMDSFAMVIAADSGKPLREAREEVGHAVNLATLAAAYIEMYGVGEGGAPALVAASATSPLYTVIHGLARAFMEGRPAVIKPATRAPLAGLAVASLAVEAGYGNLVALLTGPGAVVGGIHARMGGPLYCYGDPATCEASGGSGCMGRALALIDPAEVSQQLVESLVSLSMLHAGQACGRLAWIVTPGRHDALAGAMADVAGGLKLGDPLSPETDIGPLIDEGRVYNAGRLVDDALTKGGMLVRGGLARPPFYEPTVIARTPKASHVLWKDLVYPIIALTSADSWDEAVSLSLQLPSSMAVVVGAPARAVEMLYKRFGGRVYVDPEPLVPAKTPVACLQLGLLMGREPDVGLWSLDVEPETSY